MVSTTIRPDINVLRPVDSPKSRPDGYARPVDIDDILEHLLNPQDRVELSSKVDFQPCRVSHN